LTPPFFFFLFFLVSIIGQRLSFFFARVFSGLFSSCYFFPVRVFRSIAEKPSVGFCVISPWNTRPFIWSFLFNPVSVCLSDYCFVPQSLSVRRFMSTPPFFLFVPEVSNWADPYLLPPVLTNCPLFSPFLRSASTILRSPTSSERDPHLGAEEKYLDDPLGRVVRTMRYFSPLYCSDENMKDMF